MRDLIQSVGATGFTSLSGVSGLGHHGYHQGRLLFNQQATLELLITVVPEDKVDALLAGLRPLLDASSGVMFVSETYVSRPDYFCYPKRKVHQMSDPMSAWQRLRAGNELFFLPVQGRQQTLHQGAPAAAVFRCADTDVASEMVFGQSWGSLLDVSTWGHVVDTGVLATLEHAVERARGAADRRAGTPRVLGHAGGAASLATRRTARRRRPSGRRAGADLDRAAWIGGRQRR